MSTTIINFNQIHDLLNRCKLLFIPVYEYASFLYQTTMLKTDLLQFNIKFFQILFKNWHTLPSFLIHSMQRGMNLPQGKPPPPENENFLTSPSYRKLPPTLKMKIFWPPHNFSNSLELRFLLIFMCLCSFLPFSRFQKDHCYICLYN